MDLMPKEYKSKNNSTPFVGGKEGLAWSNLNLSGSSENKKASSSKILTIISVVLLILAISSWAALRIYQSAALKGIEDTRKQVAGIFTSEEKELAQNVVDLQKRVAAVSSFLKSHIYTSEALKAIAASTLPQVKWDSYGLKTEERQISLGGRAASYPVLAKQILALEQAKFSKIAVSGIKLDKDGTVVFSVSFEFDSKLIRK